MRFDQTDWLIHFVKDRDYGDLETEDDTEDDFLPDPAGGELDGQADAMWVLLTIIKLGGIFPGYSIRKKKTTIYGGQPVICATEMPIYAFAKYSQQGGRNVSSYGVAFLKSEFYAAGGRPVIYGLTSEKFSYLKANSRTRILDPAIMPLNEQYRYVAYSPTASRWNDWSHEREWRWKFGGREEHDLSALCGQGYYENTPALPLFLGQENGGDFSQIAIIVWTKEEALRIQTLLTSCYLAGYNNYDAQYSRALIARSKIIILENVMEAVESDRSLNAQTIEGLEAGQLLQPVIVHANTDQYQPLIDRTMEEIAIECQRFADEYVKTHPSDIDTCGYADSITYDVTNPIVQQLVLSGIASGPFDGKVVMNTPKVEPSRQSISYNEAIARKATQILNERIGDIFSTQSYLD